MDFIAIQESFEAYHQSNRGTGDYPVFPAAEERDRSEKDRQKKTPRRGREYQDAQDESNPNGPVEGFVFDHDTMLFLRFTMDSNRYCTSFPTMIQSTVLTRVGATY